MRVRASQILRVRKIWLIPILFDHELARRLGSVASLVRGRRAEEATTAWLDTVF
jgi:hypothetical protein